jgi:hypothetical protein
MSGPGDQGFLGTTPLAQRSRKQVGSLKEALTFSRSGDRAVSPRQAQPIGGYSLAAGFCDSICSSLPSLGVFPVIRCQ